MTPEKSGKSITFEEALDKTGFGLYNVYHTCVSGLVIISFACIAYGTTIIVPTSACELETTTSQQGLLAAMPLIGSLLGSPIWGYLGDTRGRRNMLMRSLLFSAIINALGSISVNWIMLTVCKCAANFMASGMYPLCITLLSESVPLGSRTVVMLMVTSIFLLSQGILAVLALPIIPLGFSYYISGLGIYWNSWRTLTVVYSLPIIISMIALLAIEESPKFLLVNGNEREAHRILEHIFRFNRNSGDFQILGLQVEESKKHTSKFMDQFIPLFKTPYLKYTIIMGTLFIIRVHGFGIWMPRILDQYVTVLKGSEGSNMTLCGIIDAAIESPPDPNITPCALNEAALLLVLATATLQSLINTLISVVVNRIGRRNMTIVTTFFIGVSGIIVNLVPNAIASGIFFAIFLLSVISVGLYTTMCVALFPTKLRTMAVALSMTGGRISSFISVQIINRMLGNGRCEAAFYIFSGLFTLSAVVAAFLPDDRLLKKAQNDTENVATTEHEDKTKF